MKIDREVLRRSLAACLPVISGYIVIGMSFGMVAVSRGFSFWWPVAMSLFIYAGSMQFVAVELICSGAGLISAAITTLMVNLRHLFYGLSMLDKYRDAGPAKPYLIFAMSDETYSLVCSPIDLDVPRARGYWLLVSVVDHAFWVLGTALGALLGSALPFSTQGIDFALTALFVSVVVEQWLSLKDHAPALIGLGATALGLFLAGPDDMLLPAMGLILLGLLIYRRREEGKA